MIDYKTYSWGVAIGLWLFELLILCLPNGIMDVTFNQSAMDDYRPRNHGDRRIEVVNGKEYSARQSQVNSSVYTHSNSYSEPGNSHGNFESVKTSKSKSAKAWSLSDPEVKRRKRVASYKEQPFLQQPLEMILGNLLYKWRNKIHIFLTAIDRAN
ncbi:hypothetical protein SUGI_0122150 [Cryptomeria japonica]|nr:hypothetical protein SUGI_0122150 [Cryptomeria japonica]